MDLKVYHEEEWQTYPAKVFAEYTYEWLGEPNEPVSVKLDSAGNELARNYFSYPFLSDRSNWILGVYSRTPVMQLEPSTEYTFHAALRKEYYGDDWAVLRINEVTSGRIVHIYNTANHPRPEEENLTVTFTTPDDGLITLQFYDNHTGSSPDGQWLTDKLIDAQIVRSDLIGDYFDGDTESDRAWVGFQPRNISDIKRIWPRSETPPPAGVHYSWEDQYAVKKQDDEVLVRNWFSYDYLSDRSNWSLFAYSLTPVLQLEPNTEYTFHAKRLKEHLSGEWGVLLIREGWSTDYRDGRIVSVYNERGPKPEIVDLTRTFTTPEDGQIRLFYYDNHRGLSPDGQWLTDKLIDAQIVRSDLIGDYFDGSTASDRANDLWYNSEGIPHEWVNGQGWTVL